MRYPLPRFVILSLCTLLVVLVMLVVGSFGLVASIYFDGLFLVAAAMQAGAVALAAGYIFSESKLEPVLSRLLLLAVIILFLCVAVSGSLLPVTARDALIHHIYVAQVWFKSGTIASVDWHEWSRYPQLLQVFYAGAERFSFVPAAVLFHASFLFLTAAVVALLCKRFGASVSLGATSMLTVPVLLTLSGEPLVDLGLLFATSLALAAVVCRWPAWVMAAALGSAMACKPNGLLVVAILFPAFILLRRSHREILKAGLLTVLCYLPVGVWCFVQSGDPIYPAAKGLFYTQASAIAGDTTATAPFKGFTVLEQRIYLYGESLGEAALVPLRIFFEGKEGVPRYFDGTLSPLLLLGFGGIFFLPKKNAGGPADGLADLFFITGFSALYLITASLLTVMRVRYMVPIVPGLALGASVMLSRKQSLVLLTQLLALGYASFITVYSNRALPIQAAYLQGHITSQQYLEQMIPEYPVIEFVNDSVPSNAGVSLILTGNQFALYQRAILSSGHNSADGIVTALLHAANADELATEMRRQGITHVVANQSSFFQLLSSKPELAQKIDIFKEAFQPIYEARGFVVAQVKGSQRKEE